MKITRDLAEKENIRISWYTEKTDLLGPFFRFVLWVQGCERKCRGCIAAHMQNTDGGKEVNIHSLAEHIIAASECEGITVSGGEPFYQADRLCTLIEKVKKERSSFGVIIYTGYTIEELKNSGDKNVSKLLGYTDILIDGHYDEELDDNAGPRGSSNQRIIPLSDRYENSMEYYEITRGRRNSIMISDDSLKMIGVPSAGSKELLKKIGII